MTGSPAANGFPVVGIVGGGQLARMTHPAAVALGVTLRVLASSCADSAALVVPDAEVGEHDDDAAVRRFSAGCDVLTFDHEHVPVGLLLALEHEGVAIRPAPRALVHAQDKLVMRERLTVLGVPCPRWAAVRSQRELVAFGDGHRDGTGAGWPVVLKTPRGGYDGKGVRVVAGPDDHEALGAVETWWEPAGERGLLAEERVDFSRELAVLVARSPSGQAAAWPVVETIQVGGVCREVVAPAPGLDPDLAARATAAALRIAQGLDVTGVMAVEMFELAEGAAGGAAAGDVAAGFAVNELAMRAHNSGHWTLDGAVTSQFEQHLRAVLDLPLGDPRPRSRWSVMVNVLGGQDADLNGTMYAAYRHVMARDPGAKVHLYGKEVRPGRKVGHVTVCGDDLDDVRDRARHAADYLSATIVE